MIDAFEELIEELGVNLGIDLHLDSHRACALRINDLLTVQIQESREEEILMGCLIIEIPPGRFRENVFTEALKSNSEYPHVGTLGFLPLKNALTLHHITPRSRLNGTSLAVLASEFIQVAEAWYTNIRDGRPGPLSSKSNSTQPKPFR